MVEGTINNRVWDLQLVKCWSCEPYLLFTTIDLSCTILKFIFLFSINAWHIYSLFNFSGYLLKRKEKKRKEKKRNKKVPSTSTCMFNIHSTFICFCTLLLIVGHHWVKLEVSLDISFTCCYPLKFDSLILCTITCYIQSNNKLLNPCLVLSPSYSRTSMC
jgi:hypothetical protein